jgi:hypothetical protein
MHLHVTAWCFAAPGWSLADLNLCKIVGPTSDI